MSITSFMNGGRGKSKVELFEEQKRGKTKEQIRELEQTMLVPGRLAPFTQAQTHNDSIKDRTVRIVFPSQDAVNLFKKYCKVSAYVEQNCTDIALILQLLEAYDAGTIDLKTGTGSEPAAVKSRNCKRST